MAVTSGTLTLTLFRTEGGRRERGVGGAGGGGGECGGGGGEIAP